VMHYLQQRIYVADEWIVSRQHPIGGMYIQGSGHTEIVDSTSKKVLWTHGSGGYFGHEKVFRVLRVDNDLDPLDSPYLARTSTESLLWFLDPVHFKRVVENFPETLNDLRFPGDMEFGVAPKGSEDRHDITEQCMRRESHLGARKDKYASDPFLQDRYLSNDWVLNPTSQWLAYWRCLVLFCNVWNTLSIPFRLAFGGHWELDEPFVMTVDYLADFVFLSDTILRSRFLAFLKDDELITESEEITRHYIRNDLVFAHLLAAIPFEVLILLNVCSVCQ
jgi:hypothetical protein